MTEISRQNFSIAQTMSLIDSYAFDLGGYSPDRILQEWLDKYNSSWIRLATIEALYLGRYKTISIEHILNVWLRLGNPNPHFTHEFERLICRKLPKHLIDRSDFHLASMSPKPENDTSELDRTLILSASDPVELQAAVNESLNSKNNKPLIPALTVTDSNSWSELKNAHTPIHQFVPLPDVSSFFKKLKTFAIEKLES